MKAAMALAGILRDGTVRPPTQTFPSSSRCSGASESEPERASARTFAPSSIVRSLSELPMVPLPRYAVEDQKRALMFSGARSRAKVMIATWTAAIWAPTMASS
jgi:hypothetical protein